MGHFPEWSKQEADDARAEAMDAVWETQALIEKYVRLSLSMGTDVERVKRYLANVRDFVLSLEAAQ